MTTCSKTRPKTTKDRPLIFFAKYPIARPATGFHRRSTKVHAGKKYIGKKTDRDVEVRTNADE